MESPQRDPAATLVAALAADLRAVLALLRRRLRDEVHPGDFTGSQMAVISRLERDGPATVTALARAEGVRPQSMGATVGVLEEAGLVIGTPDPADGRQTVLSITTACREWIEATRAAREDWLFRAIGTRLSATEVQQLAGALALLKRLVDPL